MSNSTTALSRFPSNFNIAQASFQDQNFMARTALDCLCFVESFDNAIDQFIVFTRREIARISALWDEAARHIRVILRLLILPLQTQLSNLANNFTGSLEPLLAVLFVNSTTVTYHTVLRLLQSGLRVLSRKIMLWKPHFGINYPSDDTIVPRALQEILEEALILTHSTQLSPHDTLTNLPCSRLAKHANENPLQVSPAAQSINEAWKLAAGFKPDRARIPPGYPQVISALWIDQTLFTGSTQIQWGNMGAMKYGGPNTPSTLTLHEWYRDQRYTRFTQSEQEVLNKLVRKEVAFFKAERDRQKAAGWKGHNASDRAMQVLVDSAHTRQPEVLKKAFGEHQKSHNVIGLSYEGRSFETKRKCPICTAVYIFPVAALGSEGKNWLRGVGEISRPSTALRECCGEALVFVRCVQALCVWDELVVELEREEAAAQGRERS